MSEQNHSGGCLCGAVRFTVARQISETGACHCTMCRRWAGGPFFAVDAGDAITFSGQDNITTYRSSDWAERAFCKKCGANLYYRLVEANQFFVATGALDDQSQLTMVSQVFIDEKPDFYDFANDTEKMTGAELFAKYAPPAG